MVKKDQELLTLGARLASIRGRASKTDFAESLGITTVTLSKYEDDRGNPAADFLGRLALEYDVDLNWLISGREKCEGYVDFDDKIFRRIAARVFEELRNLKLYSEIKPSELSILLSVVNHTVMSKLGPQPELEESDLEGLGEVVRFMTK